MFKWKKLGKIFDPTQANYGNWMKEFAQSTSVLLFDNCVRVYFSTRPLIDENNQYTSRMGYVDLNKNNLFEIIKVSEKPLLDLGQKGCFDEFGIYPLSIIKNNDEIFAYYVGTSRGQSVPITTSIGLAKSYDNGESFEKKGKGPLLSYCFDEPFLISGPKPRIYNNKWYLYYIAGKKWILVDGKPEPTYKIRMATSDDGINWVRYGKDIIDVKLEENEAQASPDVFYANNKYHMFFCYRSSVNYRGKEGGYRIGYASSTDLFNWTRDDSKAGIDISEDGFDNEMVAYPHLFELDSKIYMLYLGNQVGKYGFGLAELEGDLL